MSMVVLAYLAFHAHINSSADEKDLFNGVFIKRDDVTVNWLATETFTTSKHCVYVEYI